jgi:isopenicillin N synthase-like dioxygenase
MPETFSSVPTVDFIKLRSPDTKSEELAKLRDAIFVVGFLYLTNTGLEVPVNPNDSCLAQNADLANYRI